MISQMFTVNIIHIFGLFFYVKKYFFYFHITFKNTGGICLLKKMLPQFSGLETYTHETVKNQSMIFKTVFAFTQNKSRFTGTSFPFKMHSNTTDR